MICTDIQVRRDHDAPGPRVLERVLHRLHSPQEESPHSSLLKQTGAAQRGRTAGEVAQG